MGDEPIGGQVSCHLEGPRFFEEVGRPRYNRQPVLAGEFRLGLAIEFEHRVISLSHNEQGGCRDHRQARRREVGPTAARDNGTDVEPVLGGRP